MPDYSASIIIPARNEAGTIKKIAYRLPQLGERTELIFIEGRSSDDTWDEIESTVKAYSGSKILKYAKQDGEGKGDAVRKGFDMATGDILIIYDADMSVPPQEIIPFYTALIEHKADFVNGSRFIYPMEKRAMYPLNYLGNKFFNYTFWLIFGQKITDTLCGTKALWKKDYEKIKAERHHFGNFDPFGDFNLLLGAARLGLKIIDMPIHYKARVYGTTNNTSRWRHGWLLLKMVLFAIRKIKN